MDTIMQPQRSSVFTLMNFWFVLACGLFIMQYGRLYPPALESLRPFALLSFTLAGFLFISRKDFIQWKYPQMQAVWLSIAVMLLSVPMAMNYGNALLTTRSVMMFLPFMLSIIILINDVKQLKFLVNVILFVALLNAVRGFLLFDGAQRNTMFNLGAFLTDPNDFALYLNMMIPFAYFMFLQELRWTFQKLIYGILTLAMVSLVVMSFSRGGMVGLACAGMVMWYYSPNRVVTFSIGVSVLFGILLFAGDTWLNVMSTTTDLSNSTVNSRFVTWMAAGEMFIDNPIAGVGPSNVPFHLTHYVPMNHTYQFQVAHSIWFTALAEGGILGFAIFIWLLASNWSSAARLTRIRQIDLNARYLKYFGAATLASLVAYMAGGTFLTTNYYPHIWYLTALIVVGVKLLNIHHLRYQHHVNRPIHKQS